MCATSGRAILALTFALCATAVSIGRAQEPAGTNLGPLSSDPRFFLPFSATAVTTVVQRTPGGGRFSRKVTGVYYRDSSGRVRVEYAPAAETRGDARSDTDGGARKVAILLPNPYARTDRVYLVDDEAKLVEKMDFRIYGSLFNATRQLSIPTGSRRFTDFPTAESRFSGDGLFEDLGSQSIGGVRANGTRFTTTLTKAVDERWESPELGLIVRTRLVDPDRGWDVEQTLTDIQRTEPRQDLFVMPAGYQQRIDGTLSLESPEFELYRVFGKVK
jgi:hypothetical protein